MQTIRPSPFFDCSEAEALITGDAEIPSKAELTHMRRLSDMKMPNVGQHGSHSSA
jgi:beta-lactamase superfamily II metal-dependent hydrolase